MLRVWMFCVCIFFFLLWVGRRRCNYACSGKIYMQKKVIAIIGVFLVLYLQHKRWIEWKWPWDNGCNVLAPVRLPFAHSLACLCVCVCVIVMLSCAVHIVHCAHNGSLHILCASHSTLYCGARNCSAISHFGWRTTHSRPAVKTLKCRNNHNEQIT